MNYIVLRPTRAMLIVAIDQFSCMYYFTVGHNVTDKTRNASADNFVKYLNEMFNYQILPTTASTIDEVRSLHPELLI